MSAAERTAKIVVTVACYDCEPEEVAARMADWMPDDVRWHTIGPAGEFEIIDARAEQSESGGRPAAAGRPTVSATRG